MMWLSLGGAALVATGATVEADTAPTDIRGVLISLLGLVVLIITQRVQSRGLWRRVDETAAKVDATARTASEATETTQSLVEPAAAALSQLVTKVDRLGSQVEAVAREAAAARVEAETGRRESAESAARILAQLLDHANGPAHRGR